MAKTVPAAEFEAHSRELLEEVAATREEVLVTEDGKPVARLVPAVSLEELRRPGLAVARLRHHPRRHRRAAGRVIGKTE